MFYTDDPVADYHRHSDQQEKQLERLPVCCECDHPITGTHYYEFNGEYLCRQCVIDNHQKDTDDFIE